MKREKTAKKCAGLARRVRDTNIYKEEKGQAALEFAMVLPIFLLIVFFIIDFGWIAFQQASFEYGYMQSSWTVTADDIGDSDDLTEVDEPTVYMGFMVADSIRSDIISSTYGINSNEILVSDAVATFYNEEQKFTLPVDQIGEENVGSSITRYMVLEAQIQYRITPITLVGKLFFGEEMFVTKDLDRTRIVRSQSRTK